MKVGFTGTRVGMTAEQKDRLAVLFEQRRPVEFHHGDCVGADDEASRLCPSTTRIICHPGPDREQRAFAPASYTLPEKPFLQRDQEIVRACDELWATPRRYAPEQRSGTWYTIRFALQSGVPVHIIQPDGTVVRGEEIMSVKRKSNIKPGECAATRCTVAVPDGTELCVKHAAKDVAAPVGATDMEAVKAELAPVGANAVSMLQFVTTVPYDASITMSEGAAPVSGLQALSEIGVQARDTLKLLEDKRTGITKPLLQAKKAADDLFRPAKDALEALIRACNGRLAEYERARRAAQEQALAAANMGAADEHTLAAVHSSHAEPLPAEFATRKSFVIEVVNFAQVPDQFKVLNERAVQELAAQTGGACQIPGLRITEDVRVVRSGS